MNETEVRLKVFLSGLAVALSLVYLLNKLGFELGSAHFTVATTSINPFEDPIQTPWQSSPQSPSEFEKIQYGDKTFVAQKLARYVLQGRVGSIYNYRLSERFHYNPVDVAVFWGQISNISLIKQINPQNERTGFVYYRYLPTESGFDQSYVQTHFSNNHLIPKNPNLRKAFRTISPYQLIKLEGDLVYLTFNGYEYLKSSLVRTDLGGGACEAILVERLQIDHKIYE